jgi:peptide deformylase
MIVTPLNVKKLAIVHYPDPVLKRVAEPIDAFDESLSALVERMTVLMDEDDGVGLAAPQVGLSRRLFIVRPPEDGAQVTAYVNPQFLEMEGAADAVEGCLSLPGVNVTKRRATKVVLEAQDLTGKTFRLEGKDLLARIWQHEMDHLDGRLLLDNMSDSDQIANRRAVKQMEERYRG